METSLKPGFAQTFSRCPKNLSWPKLGGAAAPLAPPARTPMIPRYYTTNNLITNDFQNSLAISLAIGKC